MATEKLIRVVCPALIELGIDLSLSLMVLRDTSGLYYQYYRLLKTGELPMQWHYTVQRREVSLQLFVWGLFYFALFSSSNSISHQSLIVNNFMLYPMKLLNAVMF